MSTHSDDCFGVTTGSWPGRRQWTLIVRRRPGLTGTVIAAVSLTSKTLCLPCCAGWGRWPRGHSAGYTAVRITYCRREWFLNRVYAVLVGDRDAC